MMFAKYAVTAKLVFISVLAALLTACPDLGIDYSDKNETIEVNYYKQPCSNTSPALCFSVKNEGSSQDYQVFDNLTGFNSYEWGNYYTLNVDTSFDKNGKPQSYRFISQQAVEANDNAFNLTLYSRSGILVASDSENTQWTLGGEITFTTSAQQGAAINQAIADDEVLQLEFTAAANVLSYSSLLCSAAEDDFASQCQGVSRDSWTLRQFLSDCNYNDAALCYVYRKNSSDDWELLRTTSSEISGFTFQWGQQFTIEVEKTLSAGGQLVSATLTENDEAPDELSGSSNNFLFVLNATDLPGADSDNKIALYDGGQTMLCGSICPTIAAATDDNHMLLLDAYVDNGEIVVSRIVCNENPGTDFDNCANDEDIDWWPATR